MSYLNERVSYLKGLIEGLELKDDTKEGKVILSIVDVLEDIVDSVNDIEEAQNETNEYIESIDELLDTIEEDLYGDEYGDEDIYDEQDIDEEFIFDEDEEYEDDYDDEYADEGFVEYKCNHCGAIVSFDADTLASGEQRICPKCNMVIDEEDAEV